MNDNRNIYHNHYAFQTGATGAQGATGMGDNNWSFARDTQNVLVLDKGTLYQYPSSNRLADQSGTYGASLIGAQGVTGIAPIGGNPGDGGTVNAMLGGLANKIMDASIGSTGTLGQIPKFTSGNTMGDSSLSENGSLVTQAYDVNGPTIHQVYNSTNGTSSAASLILSTASGAPAIYATPSAYTDRTTDTKRLVISTPVSMNGINLRVGATGAGSGINFYEGDTLTYRQTPGVLGKNEFYKPVGVYVGNPETSIHISQDDRTVTPGYTGPQSAAYTFTGSQSGNGCAAFTYQYSTAHGVPPAYSATGAGAGFTGSNGVVQARTYLMSNKFIIQHTQLGVVNYTYIDLNEAAGGTVIWRNTTFPP